MNDEAFIGRELRSLFLGELLGEGDARRVYAHGTDPTLVIKVETRARSFQNIGEWEVWKTWQSTPRIGKYFAPCVSISNTGGILIQKRAAPLPKDYKLPKRLPKFMTDLKPENCGLLDGKFVLVDYGIINNSVQTALTPTEWELE